jgi:N6-L-threonylcarbamoyladenine synthase
LPRDRCFSFSGLKTALLYTLRDHPEYRTGEALADLAASYQEAAFDALIDRLERVLREEGIPRFACVGGVAKNQRLRAKLDALAKRHDCAYAVAPMAYCTDNAAMIAGLAGALTMAGHPPTPVHDVHPSLPLRPPTHQS